MSRSAVILLFVAAYLVVCMAIGVWAMRRTRTSRDFFVAGRQIGFAVAGLAMFSSTLSGFGFVGGPGLIYLMGMSSVWIIITTPPGMAVSTWLVAKRLRLLAEVRDMVSLPDAVAARYGSESTRFLTAIAILLGVVGYLATQILAMSTVLQSLLADVPALAGVSLLTCVVISTSVLLFYSVTGGVIAGVYTDVMQGVVMIVASALVFAAAVAAVDGGATGAVTTLVQDDPESMGPWGTMGLIGCLSWYLLFTLGGAGQPHIVTKNLMYRRVRDAAHALPVSLGAYTFSALLWIGIGIAMRAVVIQGGHPPLSTPDEAAASFLQAYASPLLAGIVFAALFAAIMSTADAFLNIGAAALVHDLPLALKGRAATNELRAARIATLGLGGAGAAFALYSHYANERLIGLLGAFGWGTFAAALVPVVAIGLNWKRATPLAANVAIVVSLVVNFVVEVFDVTLPHGLHGGTVALVLSLLLFVGISYASASPRLPADVEAVMDL
jgi:Na+/proline symporter